MINKRILGLSLLLLPHALQAADPIDGRKIYERNCMACHGDQGIPSSEVFPPLAGSEWIRGNAGRMVEIILGGLAGEITVKGKQYNLLMPTQGAAMTDEEIAAAATYVRSSWGHQETPVTADFVKNLRSSIDIGESLEAHKVLAKYPLPADLEIKNAVSQSFAFEDRLPLNKQAITTASPIHTYSIPHPKNTLAPHSSQNFEGSHRTLHTGDLHVFADGAYEFEISASGWAEVKINNEVIATSTEGSITRKKVDLKQGSHPVTFQTYAFSGNKKNWLVIRPPVGKIFPLAPAPPARNIWKATDRPVIYRNILKDSSARGMAIGFPSGLNILLDLESSHLTKLWSGDFIDVNTHFVFRGETPAGASGENVLILNRPLAARNDAVDLKSYTLSPAGDPVFSYKIGKIPLTVFYQSSMGTSELNRHFLSGGPIEIEIARFKKSTASITPQAIETKRWKITPDRPFKIATEGDAPNQEEVVYLPLQSGQKAILKYQLKP